MIRCRAWHSHGLADAGAEYPCTTAQTGLTYLAIQKILCLHVGQGLQVPSTISALISSCPLFDGLADDDLTDFIAQCELRHYPTDTVILRKSEYSPGLFVITAGSVEIRAMDASNRQIILHNAISGQILGDIECVAQAPVLADCVARSGTEACFMEAETYFKALDHPILRRNQARINYRRIEFANASHLRRLTRSVEVQIGACLLQLAAECGTVTHSQAYIADMVGCSRQTANRVLGEMKDKGWLSLRKGMIALHQPDAISDMIT